VRIRSGQGCLSQAKFPGIARYRSELRTSKPTNLLPNRHRTRLHTTVTMAATPPHHNHPHKPLATSLVQMPARRAKICSSVIFHRPLPALLQAWTGSNIASSLSPPSTPPFPNEDCRFELQHRSPDLASQSRLLGASGTVSVPVSSPAASWSDPASTPLPHNTPLPRRPSTRHRTSLPPRSRSAIGSSWGEAQQRLCFRPWSRRRANVDQGPISRLQRPSRSCHTTSRCSSASAFSASLLRLWWPRISCVDPAHLGLQWEGQSHRCLRVESPRLLSQMLMVPG
jgi:hypothetical protein